MAKDKKGFVLYADQRSTFDKLPDDKAGELIKHIFAYVNDEDPEPKDLIIDIAFEPIKNQLKRDLKKWEEIREKRSKAGKISAESKKQKQHVLTNVESVDQTLTKSTVKDTVNVNDNVNDNESVINTIGFISKKFGISEVKHFLNYRTIHNCVVCQFNLGDELFKHFKDQVWNYFIYKDLAQEKLHSFKGFIGNPEEKYINGGWNAENWIKKHNDLKAKEAGIDSVVYPSDDNETKKYPSKKRNYNETDLTKIGDLKK